MLSNHGKFVSLMVVVAVLTSLVGCGGSAPTATPQPTAGKAGVPTATAAPQATQPKAANPTATSPAKSGNPTATPVKPSTSGSSDISSRVSDSVELLLDSEKTALKSYHLEASGKDPQWDSTAKQVQSKTWTVKADVAGTDLYLLSTSQLGGAAAAITEGYSINGGLSGDSGKEYTVVNGKLQESMGAVSMSWVFLPLQIILPMSIASLGTTAQGSDTIDGRAADKYALDSAGAPAGTVGILSGMFSITSAKGTAWVDKQTGALLKASIDYEQNLVDPPGSQTSVGKGTGHLEILVTKVGNVTVTLPKQ